jgi:hypothetical protein
MQQIEEENKKVLAILRDERTRGFRIEIETDSTCIATTTRSCSASRAGEQ